MDKGLSLTLFFKDTVTIRDLNKAQIYAWGKGIKTLYYIRLRQLALEDPTVARITRRSGAVVFLVQKCRSTWTIVV